MNKSIHTSENEFSPQIRLWPQSGTQAAAENQFRTGKPLHAYLLIGAKGIGKQTFARILSAYLYCENNPRPCLQCNACKQIFSDNHPQILTLFSEEGKTIGVDSVRDILTKISRYSLQDGMRIVMIEPMEKLTPAAQNALLKQLEEPAENVVFLLMTHDMSATLGTIASRCVRIHMSSRSDDEIRTVMQALHFDGDTIEKILPHCSGNIGQAIEAAAWSTRQDEAADLVRRAIQATGDAQAVKISTYIKENREIADEFLLLLEQQIAQLLSYAVTGSSVTLPKDFPQSWRNAANIQDISQINFLLRALFDTRKQKANAVNLQASIDQLLIQLVEAQSKWQKLSV